MTTTTDLATQFERDLAYYTDKFAVQQAEQDAFDDEFGIPRTDLAWVKCIDRLAWRSRPRLTWEEQQARWREERERALFAAAIGEVLA